MESEEEKTAEEGDWERLLGKWSLPIEGEKERS